MVMVISGIVMAIALPKLTGYGEVDVYNAAEQVRADFTYTQELAKKNYRKTTITFVANTNTYTISVDAMHSVPTLNRTLPPGSKATFNPVGSGTTGLVYTFNSYGEADLTNNVDNHLGISTPGGSYREIYVKPKTGRSNIIGIND